MKLRTHVNLIVACLSAAFIVLMLVVEIDRARRAVHEEIGAANIVATQLLSRVAQTYERDGPLPVLLFLKHLGRVRANEIELHNARGELLYRSPPATYKAGREAPAWFARVLLPPLEPRVFSLAGGAELSVEANPSRAILDGWDDFVELLLVGGAAFAVLNLWVFWLVGQALAPLPVIASGLKRIEQGELSYRLPQLSGHEAGAIGAAFNRMVLAVEEKWQAERRASDAQARLDESRELSQLIEQRLDEERRSIARELHDEFAQSVTAIRTLAVMILGRHKDADATTIEAAQTISNEAARLYDAMHSLIPRLAPVALDTLGLAATLQGLVNEWQQRHPGIKLTLRQNLPSQLGSSVTLTIYRIVQEALLNALRHAHPTQVDIAVDSQADRLTITVVDDGVGLPPEWARAGRFGLRGLRERIDQLHGNFRIANREPRGVEITAHIPLNDEPLAQEITHDSRASG